MSRPAIFLDRDGTIIEESHYLSRPEQIRWLPGAREAIREWNRHGVPVIVVSNQSGVARGYFDEDSVRRIHEHLRRDIEAFAGKIDAFYYCPHHPDGTVDGYRTACDCRKPRPGMLLTAAREHDLDLNQSWIIGDKLDDARAGDAAGCRPLLVQTGHLLPAQTLYPLVENLWAAWEYWQRQQAKSV